MQPPSSREDQGAPTGAYWHLYLKNNSHQPSAVSRKATLPMIATFNNIDTAVNRGSWRLTDSTTVTIEGKEYPVTRTHSFFAPHRITKALAQAGYRPADGDYYGSLNADGPGTMEVEIDPILYVNRLCRELLEDIDGDYSDPYETGCIDGKTQAVEYIIENLLDKFPEIKNGF